MAGTEGTVTVKLVLDTSEFWPELARVREAILELEGLGGDSTPPALVEAIEYLKQGGSIAPRATVIPAGTYDDPDKVVELGPQRPVHGQRHL